ncbi:lymphocyte activation gene 3 protein [Salmo salar]|uniref:Lymphocyte activation gene 3 protein n=1 Tax=Salmo salar TaxID=8030 RepID=A0A1S3N2U9_SALSA|nr:lymphocyte activation gene 3 protein-like [Salmo salar]
MWQILLLLGTSLLGTGGRCQCLSEYTEMFAEAGSQAVLPCVCRPPSTSAAVVLWSKDLKGTVWRKGKSGLEHWGIGAAQRFRCSHSEVGAGDYSLYIKEVREEDSGNYTCTVQDGEKILSKRILLRVIKVSISPPAPVEGNKMTITCSVSPWPQEATVSWMLNEKRVYPDSADYVLSKNQASVLESKASAGMMGNWSCVMHKGRKQGKATTALTVRGIVNPFSASAKVYAEVGSAVTLPCVFSTGLTPSDTAWERLDTSGSALPLPPSFNLSSLLSLPPWDRSVGVGQVGQGDGGRYRCSGTVEGRRVTREMQLVTAQVLSNSPSTQKAPVSLTCHLSDASEVTEYEWVRVTYDLNGTQSESSVQKGRVLGINRVTDRNSGEWACRFHGKEGALGSVTYHLHLMSGLMGDNETGSSSNVAMVAGLGFFLLVLLLVLVQMYRNYRRRKLILLYPALENIVHTIANEREDRERNRVKEDEISK